MVHELHSIDKGVKMKKIFVLTILAIILAGNINVVFAQPSYRMVAQWGEFGNKPGQFKYPAMIAVDVSSNLYVVDQNNHRIQKFDAFGNFILMWGEKGTDSGQFNYPYGIAVNKKGDVFVSDMNNHRIQKFSSDGDFKSAIGAYGPETSQFKHPYGMAVDSEDRLYVVDAFNYRIQIFDRDLIFQNCWGSEEQLCFRLYMPHEIVIDKNQNLILSDRQNHRLSIFSRNGELIYRVGEYGEGIEASGGQFSEPHGVAVAPNGDMFVCDRYNFRVQRMNAKGDYLSKFNTAGPIDDSKHFNLGIAIAADGSIYVTDHYQHCVQKYRPLY